MTWPNRRCSEAARVPFIWTSTIGLLPGQRWASRSLSWGRWAEMKGNR
jgi:hypothetical protein